MRFKLHHYEYPQGDRDTTNYDTVEDLFVALNQFKVTSLKKSELDCLAAHERGGDFRAWIKWYNRLNALPNEYFGLEDNGVVVDTDPAMIVTDVKSR